MNNLAMHLRELCKITNCPTERAAKFTIVIIYFISHGLILLLSGLWWDDWATYRMPPGVIENAFIQYGAPWIGYYHTIIQSLPGNIFLYRTIVFLSFLLSSLLCYDILKRIKEIDSTSRLFIVLLFCVFPANAARVALINSSYALCYLFFFLGFYLLVYYMELKQIWIRLLAIAFFFVSFFTNSFLFYYAIVPIYIIYKEKGFIRLYRYCEIVLLPIIFFIAKLLLWNPYGNYTGYNAININGLVKALPQTTNSFITGFISVINQSLDNIPITLISILISATFLLMATKQQRYNTKKRGTNTYSLKPSIILILFGLLFFFLAVFPYNVVGAPPAMYDWHSRNQLLVPLGASILIYYSINLIFGKRKNISNALLVFLISTFTLTNILTYSEYQKDWYKQASIIENIRGSHIIRENQTFLINDDTTFLNARNRRVRFYEYSGMMKLVFNDESRFAEDQYFYYTGREPYYKYFNSHFNLEDYTGNYLHPQYYIILKNNTLDLNNTQTLIMLKFNEIFNKEEFSELLLGIVKLDIKPVTR